MKTTCNVNIKTAIIFATLATLLVPLSHANEMQSANGASVEKLVATKSEALVQRKLQGVTFAIEPIVPPNPKPYADIVLTAQMTGVAANSVTKIRYIATRTDGVASMVESSAMPFRATLRSLGAGAYTIRATAWDATGASVDALAISFNWQPRPMMLPTIITPPPPPPPPPPPANVAPSVSINAPTTASSALVNSTVNIAAIAADVDGSITKVEFFVGATKLGEDVTSPYTMTWTPSAAGQVSLTARATDDKGATTTSASVVITVNAATPPPPPPPPPANVAPTVSITSPAASSVVLAAAVVNITANAADSDGTITKVEFFAGSTKLGEDVTSPYAVTWTPSAAGQVSLTARATDDKGAITTSAGVVITVNAATPPPPPPPPPANVAPTVSITSPAASSSAAAAVAVNITANAADADGTITLVEFFAGTTKLGEDSVAPFVQTWTPTVAGAVSLTARATDNKGATTTSPAISINVMAAPPPPPPPTSSITPEQVDAARLLTQTTFGVTRAEIIRVAGMTPSAYLAEQFAQPQTSHVSTVLANPSYTSAPWSVMMPSIWKQYFEGNDQLRQRIVSALSQILVVSQQNNTLGDQACSVAGYLDMLGRHAFGNFRDVLRDATLSPAMGEYLDMKNSAKANPALNGVPNENFARELLQLFAIGTVMLNADGSVQFANGKPIDTYSEETVQEFARALTGWTFANQDQTKPWRWLYPDVPYPNDTASGQKACTAWSTPMQPWTASYRSSDDKTTLTGGAHDMGAKTLLNYPGADNFKRQLPANQTAQKDVEDVIDNIFNHPNVGPFIGEQLIQRLVMSNPSGAYVARVTAAFNNNGSGIRGDMKAVIRAVLLDSEARQVKASQPTTYGKLREPVLRFTHLHRAFGAKMQNGNYMSIWDLGGADALGQSPVRAPSVFNYYHTDYAPSGVLLRAGLVGPEFEITNSATLSGFMDFSKWGIVNGFGQYESDTSKWIKPNYDEYIALANTPAAMVDALNLVLLSGSMSAAFRASLIDVATKLTDSNAATQSSERFKTVFWLIMNSPEYSIQK